MPVFDVIRISCLNAHNMYDSTAHINYLVSFTDIDEKNKSNIKMKVNHKGTITLIKKEVSKMKSKIILKTPHDVEEFVNAAAKCDGEVDLTRGVVFIDGKSLLGVMTMGLERELEVRVTGAPADKFKQVVKKFAVA